MNKKKYLSEMFLRFYFIFSDQPICASNYEA